MSTTTPQPEEDVELVFLDCDPGHDDAMAIILAGYSKRIKLLGISTICGNQTVEKTTLNALRTISYAGLDHIDVARGQHKAMVRPARECPEIHGSTGLDGTDLPPISKKPIDKKAVLHMYDVISQQQKKVTLVGTAQLTNIALLLTLFPEVKEHLSQIVIMGGSIGIGNMAPAAEWNIMADPEAAKVVFESDVKVVMVPLEVTHTALCTPDVMLRIRKLDSKFSKLIVELLTFFEKTYREVFKFEYPPLHDPCAICYVIDPSLFKTELMRVDVECSSSLCDGRTVCDIFHFSTKPKNVHVALTMDVHKFFDHFIEAIELANKNSPLN